MPAPCAYRLSPYCVVHADPGGATATLVHALYGSRFVIAAEVLAALASVNAGAGLDQVLATVAAGARAAIEELVAERILVPAEELDATSAQALFEGRLDPIELAVQRGFNEGGYDPAQVASRRPPAVAKEMKGLPAITLQWHDMPGTSTDLVACLQARRSARRYGEGLLDKRDFERFLQLSLGVQAIVDAPASGPVALRAYPSAGALHPLEIYPVVYHVESIEPGLYHYDAFRHQLALLPSESGHRSALARMAMYRLGQLDVPGPAVLLLVTARINRTCWKYTGMAYQSILMETGALYQTMYLVATLLGLAPCAVGAFPERATAEILGVDSRDEAQVGLFALGARDPAAEPRRIVAVRPVDPAPFAPGRSDRAVEFTYPDGTREIVPRDRLQIGYAQEGELGSTITLPRGVAILEASARSDLLALLGD